MTFQTNYWQGNRLYIPPALLDFAPAPVPVPQISSGLLAPAPNSSSYFFNRPQGDSDASDYASTGAPVGSFGTAAPSGQSIGNGIANPSAAPGAIGSFGPTASANTGIANAMATAAGIAGRAFGAPQGFGTLAQGIASGFNVSQANAAREGAFAPAGMATPTSEDNVMAWADDMVANSLVGKEGPLGILGWALGKVTGEDFDLGFGKTAEEAFSEAAIDQMGMNESTGNPDGNEGDYAAPADGPAGPPGVGIGLLGAGTRGGFGMPDGMDIQDGMDVLGSIASDVLGNGIFGMAQENGLQDAQIETSDTMAGSGGDLGGPSNAGGWNIGNQADYSNNSIVGALANIAANYAKATAAPPGPDGSAASSDFDGPTGFGAPGAGDSQSDSTDPDGMSIETSDTIAGNTESEGEGGGDSAGGAKLICTELNRQGMLDSSIYAVDEAFASMLRRDDPLVVIGYQSWARHVVKAMRKSRVVTKAVALLAKPWAYEMAHRMGAYERGNAIGWALMEMGVPICRLIGRALTKTGSQVA